MVQPPDQLRLRRPVAPWNEICSWSNFSFCAVLPHHAHDGGGGVRGNVVGDRLVTGGETF